MDGTGRRREGNGANGSGGMGRRCSRSKNSEVTRLFDEGLSSSVKRERMKIKLLTVKRKV